MSDVDIFMPKDQGYVYPVLGWDDADVDEITPADTAEDVFGSLTPLGVYRITCLPATSEGHVRLIPASESDPDTGDYDTACAFRTEYPVEVKLLPGQDRIGLRNDSGGAGEFQCVRIQ